MNDSEQLQVVRKIVDGYMSGDAGPLFEALASDVTMRLTIGEGTPLSGVFQGAQGIGEYFARNGATVDTHSMEVLNYLAGGGQVAVTGRESLTVRKTGTRLENSDWVMLYTFTGDKISSILLVEDTALIASAYANGGAELKD